MTPSARRSPGIRGNKYDVVPPLLRMRIAEGVFNEIEEELVDEESVRAVKAVMSDLADEFMYAFIRDDLATNLLQDVVQDCIGHMVLCEDICSLSFDNNGNNNNNLQNKILSIARHRLTRQWLKCTWKTRSLSPC